MKNYADLWLGYRKIEDPGDTSLLKMICISGASESDKVVANAVSELRTGLKAMLGIEPVIEFGSAGAPVSINSGKDMQDAESIIEDISNEEALKALWENYQNEYAFSQSISYDDIIGCITEIRWILDLRLK